MTALSRAGQEKFGDFVGIGGGGAPPSGVPAGVRRPCSAKRARTLSRSPRACMKPCTGRATVNSTTGCNSRFWPRCTASSRWNSRLTTPLTTVTSRNPSQKYVVTLGPPSVASTLPSLIRAQLPPLRPRPPSGAERGEVGVAPRFGTVPLPTSPSRRLRDGSLPLPLEGRRGPSVRGMAEVISGRVSWLAQAFADDAGDRVQHVFQYRAAADLDVADDAHAGPHCEAFRQVAEFGLGELDAGAVVGRALPRFLFELGRGSLLAGFPGIIVTQGIRRQRLQLAIGEAELLPRQRLQFDRRAVADMEARHVARVDLHLEQQRGVRRHQPHQGLGFAQYRPGGPVRELQHY